MTSRSTLTVGIALGASLFLAACGNGGDTPAPETVTESAAPETSEATNGGETTATSEETTAQQNGDDPAFGAIDAVLAEHSGGTIVDIDRDDEQDTYDVDVVVDNEVIELEVASDGTVREDEREGDDDDIQEAQNATVTAEDAIREALNQHPEGVLDEAQLDEDDGNLSWDINLDDQNREDLAEVTLPAT